MTRLALLLAAIVVAVGVGCRSQPRPVPTTPVSASLPDYAAVASQYNARLQRLDRLYARTTLRVWYPDRTGEESTEQVEGQLNIDMPDRVALTFTKVGELYGVLGCDPEEFWWIELGSAKRARVARHAGASLQQLRDAGLPVHPLDLVELLALAPLPSPGNSVSSGDSPTLSLTSDGDLLVLAPARTTWRRLRLDRATLDPKGVELLDRDRAVLVSSTIDTLQPAQTFGAPVEGAATPRVPRQVMVSADSGRVRARLTIYGAEADAKRPRPEVFDLKTWVSRYRVEDVGPFDAEANRQ